MKKNVKQRFNALFLALCLLSVFLLPVFANSTELTTRAIAESQSYLQYQLLTTAFKHQNLRGEIADAYPDYYAGAYIREDGKLVVLLTNTAKTNTDAVYALARSSDLIVSTATVSLNELTVQRELIANAWQTLRQSKAEDMPDDLLNLLDSFVGFGIEERNNRIVVTLKDISEENITLFQKYISSYTNIYFEACDGVEAHTELKLGDSFYAAGGYGSIGYRCYYTNASIRYTGFATAAHAAINQGQDILSGSGGERYGETQIWQYSGTLDAAFVQRVAGVTIANHTPEGKVIANTWCTSFPEGMTVYKRGKTTHETSGTIKNSSYSFTTASGISLSDTLRCNYNSDAGDSGGIVFTLINGDYTVVGLHHGVVDTVLGIGGRAIAIKAHNFYTIHGVTPY